LNPVRVPILPILLVAGLLLGAGCCQRPMPQPQDGRSEEPVPAGEEAAVPSSPGDDTLPTFDALFLKVSPSIVNISATLPFPFPEETLTRREKEVLKVLARSLGSGFVFDREGHVVTCSSVVLDEERQPLENIEVILASGKRIQARLTGSDDISDLAVLRIPPEQAPPPLPLGTSTPLKVGDWVAAVGYAFGLSHSITAGIVSAIRSAEEMKASHGLILSDAAINPGCNGGPLLDTKGRVVGINLIPGQEEGSMGLAIPIEDALQLLEILKTGHHPQRPWLGVSVQPVDSRLKESFRLPSAEGALVTRVVEGGPADQAGLQPGDVLYKFAGRPVEDPVSLIEAVKSAALNRKVKIRLYRKGKRKTVTIIPRPAPY
jgi:S1-C subfamily serine protease